MQAPSSEGFLAHLRNKDYSARVTSAYESGQVPPMPPGWTMHKLRHRFATRGYAGTHNLRAVQEALGHVSVATTQRYTAVSSREVRLVSEAASGGDYVA